MRADMTKEFNALKSMPIPQFIEFASKTVTEMSNAPTLSVSTNTAAGAYPNPNPNPNPNTLLFKSENELQDKTRGVTKKTSIYPTKTQINTNSAPNKPPVNQKSQHKQNYMSPSRRSALDHGDTADDDDDDNDDFDYDDGQGTTNDDDVDDDEELQNEVALIRREYRVKQLLENNSHKNSSPHTQLPKYRNPPLPRYHHTYQHNQQQQQLQRNSVTTTHMSTPTYSSSLPSENSLSSPSPAAAIPGQTNSNESANLLGFSFMNQTGGVMNSPKIITTTMPKSNGHVTTLRNGGIGYQSLKDPPGQVVILSPKISNISNNQSTTTTRLSGVTDRFVKQHHMTPPDDENNSLRRNSYTKAIFYENEHI